LPEEVKATCGPKTDRRMEICMLDRGIRWADGSKAKRSKLLSNTSSGLFRDATKSVAEQLRDALISNSMRVMDLFREWDTNCDGHVSIDEFKRALRRLGLVCHNDAVEGLFEEFDLDRNGAISFRELNKQLRRDVKAEVRGNNNMESSDEGTEIADYRALRRKAMYKLLNISNTEVCSIDPLTGERVFSGGGSDLRLPAR